MIGGLLFVKRKLLFFVIPTVFFLIIGTLIFILVRNDNEVHVSFQEYFGDVETSEEFFEKMSLLNDKQVIEVTKSYIETCEEDSGYEGLMLFAPAFNDVLKNLSEDEIFSMIFDPENHDMIKVLILQSQEMDIYYTGGTKEHLVKLKDMITDVNVGNEVKINIVLNYNFTTDEDIAFLTSLTNSSDKYIAIQAERKLKMVQR